MIGNALYILWSKSSVKEKIRVTNRKGGSGTKCMDYIASKKGDPYVLGATSGAPLNTVIRKSSVMRYEDITFVSNLIEDPNYVSAKYDAPYNNMKELVAWAKKSGRDLNVAIGSVGGMDHITAYRIGKETGMKLNIISFKSSGGSAVAILGGHADIRVGSYVQTMDPASKQVKALSVNTAIRNPFLPDVLTLKEQGIDVIGAHYRGFWAPQDFPPYAIKFWEDAFLRLSKSKGFNDYMKSGLGMPSYKTSKEMKALFDEFVNGMERDLKHLKLYEKKKKK